MFTGQRNPPRFKDSWLFSPQRKEDTWNKIKAELPRDHGSPASRDNQRAHSDSADPLDKFYPIEGTTQSPEYFLETYKSVPKGEVSDLKNFPPLIDLFRKYNTPLCSRKVLDVSVTCQFWLFQ